MSARNRLWWEPDYENVCDWTTETFDRVEQIARREAERNERKEREHAGAGHEV